MALSPDGLHKRAMEGRSSSKVYSPAPAALSCDENLSSERSRLVKRHLTALTHMTYFTVDELFAWLDRYKAFASLSDGMLNRIQFEKLIYTFCRFKKPLVRHLFVAFDVDGDHSISFDEWIVHASILQKGSPEEALRFLFHVYDRNHDGSLELEEIEEMIECMLPEETRRPSRSRLEREMVRALPRLLPQYEAKGRLEVIRVTPKEFLHICVTHPLFVRIYDSFRDAIVENGPSSLSLRE
eukprot:ANDGO_08411.mRNA.1 Calcium-binding protein M